MTLQDRVASVFGQVALTYFTHHEFASQVLDTSSEFTAQPTMLAAAAAGAYMGNRLAQKDWNPSLDDNHRNFIHLQGLTQYGFMGACILAVGYGSPEWGDQLQTHAQYIATGSASMFVGALATGLYGLIKGWFGGDDRRGGGFDDSPDPVPDPGKAMLLPAPDGSSPVNDYSPVMSTRSEDIEAILNDYKLPETDNDSRSRYYVNDI